MEIPAKTLSPEEPKLDGLADENYIRQRLCPLPADAPYLHLSDLLLALQEVEISQGSIVLDYGAGGSPYRSLFIGSQYRRADFSALGDVEYPLLEDGTVLENSDTFDLVLSTQVLEHVKNPDTYLSECFRLLKPGGRLLLSTHGLFEDHGCPHDFQRWTADGLKRDLERAGFEILTINKLTSGPRALMFLIDRYVDTTSLSLSWRTLPGMLHWIARGIVRRYRGWLHVQLDRHCPDYRIVPSSTPGHIMYIALLCCARRH